MRGASAHPARLALLLLGFVLLAILGWRLLPIRDGDRSLLDRSLEPRSRSPFARTDGLVPEPRSAGDAGNSPSPHGLSMPVAGVDARALQNNFSERRGGTRPHEALDILAPRGTKVLAADDGVVRKLFTSVPGGLTVYEFDLEERYCFYYAHLDRYAPELHEGQRLRKGDLVGYVGTTGNAPKNTPHLHFSVSRLDPDKKWWTGTPIDPYPLLVKAP